MSKIIEKLFVKLLKFNFKAKRILICSLNSNKIIIVWKVKKNCKEKV